MGEKGRGADGAKGGKIKQDKNEFGNKHPEFLLQKYFRATLDFYLLLW